jgi:hypothetical protein
MRRLVLASILGLSLTLGSAMGVAAADPGSVSYVGCVFANGGSAIVPAGAPVTITFGWFSSTRHDADAFLKAALASISVDGQPVSHANAFFSAPSYDGPDDVWITSWAYPTGRSLASAESMTVVFNVYLSRKVIGLRDPSVKHQLKAGPGFVLDQSASCAISGS